MVHNFLCAPSFKAWTPTQEELRHLTRNNKYCMAETPAPDRARADHLLDAGSPVTVSLKMTKHINITIDKRSAVSYVREDALQLLARMQRAGIYCERDEMHCIVCDIDKMERYLLSSYHKELAGARNVRNFVLHRDNHRHCKLCQKHRPFEASVPEAARLVSPRRRMHWLQQQPPPPVAPANTGFSYGELLQMVQEAGVEAVNRCGHCSGYYVVCQCAVEARDTLSVGLSRLQDRVPMPTFYYRMLEHADKLWGGRPICKRPLELKDSSDGLSAWFDYLTHPEFEATRMPYTRMFAEGKELVCGGRKVAEAPAHK